MTLYDLQASVQDRNGFAHLGDYLLFARSYLRYLREERLVRVVSPTHRDYCFFQYPENHEHRITRPLNTALFLEDSEQYEAAFGRAVTFLGDLRRTGGRVAETRSGRRYLAAGELNAVVYTAQQSVGCVGDSFRSPNQARKRVGQLFERLVKLAIQEVGVECEPRTVRLPVPGFDGYTMPYELDVVFSRSRAVITSETEHIRPHEVVGSVKTTSKDRIDKIFLDKHMLRTLLGRDIPVVALFLHDVQRASRGASIFGVASTFKKNHFLGYTVALNRLDGVYYVDPRPEMFTEERLREQIGDFQRFIGRDLWTLTAR
jgi:hypothetical protein